MFARDSCYTGCSTLYTSAFGIVLKVAGKDFYCVALLPSCRLDACFDEKMVENLTGSNYLFFPM